MPSPASCHSVEVPIISQRELRGRRLPVGTAALKAKTINRGEFSAGSHAEDLALTGIAASTGRAIEVSVGPLSKRLRGFLSVSELGKEGHLLCLGADRQAESEGRACQRKAKTLRKNGIMHRKV